MREESKLKYKNVDRYFNLPHKLKMVSNTQPMIIKRAKDVGLSVMKN